MTQRDRDTSDPGSQLTRRDVLRSVGGIGILGSVGDVLGESVGGLVPVNVGYRDDSGFKAAAGLADEVVRTFDFDAATITVPERILSNVGQLATEESIRYVEPDRTMVALGQSVPWGIDRIDADTAHDHGVSGNGVDIAILDSGIDSTHPDLRANLGQGTSFIDSFGLLSTGQTTRDERASTSITANTSARSTTFTDDDAGYDGSQDSRGGRSRASGLLFDSEVPEWHDGTGHGTHCAGTVGAVDNSEGVVGVCPGATLHAVRVLNSSGYGSASDIAAGIDYIVKQEWDVANLSLGGRQDVKLVRDACKHAVEQGTLLVAAAGNDGPCRNCVRYPAAYPGVVSVGATTRTDELLSYSATGPKLDLVAPGMDIRSTFLSDRQPYAAFTGTSMAAPHVAGSGGLLMAQGYDNTDAAARMKNTAEDIGLSKNEGGAGLLDVPAALGL